jgi:hypothetical protein
MGTQTATVTSAPASVFPAEEARRRLREELQKIGDDASVLGPEWVPLLDSKRVVGTVLAIEDLFPFKLPPDKVVRKGGYNSVDEAIDSVLGQIEKIWTERCYSKVRK